MAAQHLITSWSAPRFAELDPDEFYDFTASRPWVGNGENSNRAITWPGVQMHAHQSDGDGIDAIIMLGTEPGLRWKTFTGEIVDLCRSLDVSMAVTLGSHLAQVSHRDPVPVTGWARPDKLHARLAEVDVGTIEYEGPTGLVTVLSCALAEARIPVASLWAALPTFLGPTPNPRGALALATHLDRALGLGLPMDKLSEASRYFERQVNQAIQRIHAMPGAAVFQVSQDGAAPAGQSEAKPGGGPSSTDVTELPSVEEAIQTAEEILRQSRGS